jgi:hypothetical protein
MAAFKQANKLVSSATAAVKSVEIMSAPVVIPKAERSKRSKKRD